MKFRISAGAGIQSVRRKLPLPTLCCLSLLGEADLQRSRSGTLRGSIAQRPCGLLSWASLPTPPLLLAKRICMVGNGPRFRTSRDIEASPIDRWLDELGCRRCPVQSFPKVVIVCEHDIKPKFFSLRENLAILWFRVRHLKLAGPSLNGSDIPNSVAEK